MLHCEHSQVESIPYRDLCQFEESESSFNIWRKCDKHHQDSIWFRFFYLDTYTICSVSIYVVSKIVNAFDGIKYGIPIHTLWWLINVHGRPIILEKKSTLDILIRHWTLISFLLFVKYKRPWSPTFLKWMIQKTSLLFILP